MPTYEYRCKDCGHELEAQQAFTDDALTECPTCGGALKKQFGSVGISFKGSGFYKNDARGTSSSTSTSTSDAGTTGGDTAATTGGDTAAGSGDTPKKATPASESTAASSSTPSSSGSGSSGTSSGTSAA